MQKLIFVYNLESGIVNSISDYGRSAFKTQPCNLYALIHGPFGIKSEWKHFIKKLDEPAEFLRKDEFIAKNPKALIKGYPKNISYPCVVVRKDDKLEILITPEEINNCKELDALMDLATGKLIANEKN